MVGEATAYVQGESPKAFAAFHLKASQLPDHVRELRMDDDQKFFPPRYFDERPPKATFASPQGLLMNGVMLLVALAAVVYVGQFFWSFKTAADDKQRAERAEATRIINEELYRQCISAPDVRKFGCSDLLEQR